MDNWDELMTVDPRRHSPLNAYALQCAEGIYAWAKPGDILHCRRIKAAYTAAARSRGIRLIDDQHWGRCLEAVGFVHLLGQSGARRYFWQKPG